MRPVVKTAPEGSVHINRNGAVPLAEQVNMAVSVVFIVREAGETVAVGGTAREKNHEYRNV